MLSKYALFSGPLLCEWDADEGDWFVINGHWYFDAVFGDSCNYPDPVWTGSKLPIPGGDYNDNIRYLENLLQKADTSQKG